MKLRSVTNPKRNPGGINPKMYVANVDEVVTEGVVEYTDDWVEGTGQANETFQVVADIATRDALVPAAGWRVYVKSLGEFQEYDGSNWVVKSPFLITDSHTFAGTDGFHEIQLNTSGFSAETEASEPGSTGSVIKHNIPLNGIGFEREEIAALLGSGQFIVLIPRSDGTVLQYGTVTNPATFNKKGAQFGEKANNRAGHDLELEFSGDGLIEYRGAITPAT